MKSFSAAFCLSTLALCAAGLAADIEIPAPSVDDLHPAILDWAGPYIGVFASGTSAAIEYDATCTAPCAPGARDLEGFGWNNGVYLGGNVQMDQIVLGVEADWAFGGKVADYDDAAETTEFSIDNLATLRARLGFAFDNSLLYATGGVAFADTEFASSADLIVANDAKWITGYVIGGGLEHAVTDNISTRIEYTYLGLPDVGYLLSDGINTADISQDFDGIHVIRVGLSYNFGL